MMIMTTIFMEILTKTTLMIFTSLVALSIISFPKSSSVSTWDMIMMTMVITMITDHGHDDYSEYVYDDDNDQGDRNHNHDEKDNYYQKTAFDEEDEILHVLLITMIIWTLTSIKSFRRSIASSLLEISSIWMPLDNAPGGNDDWFHKDKDD